MRHNALVSIPEFFRWKSSKAMRIWKCDFRATAATLWLGSNLVQQWSLRYEDIKYSTSLHYSTLGYSISFHSALVYGTLFYSILVYATQMHSTLLYSTLDYGSVL